MTGRSNSRPDICRRFVAGVLFALLLAAGGTGCGGRDDNGVKLAAGGRVKSLDPALADDLASRNMTAAVYDTLLTYDYTARPYRLKPSMLRRMPEVSPDGTRYRFRLREDLFFIPDACFGGKRRAVTAQDVVYSFLRLADARLHSPGYWMFRGKIAGLDEFYDRSRKAAPGDDSIYSRPPKGFRIVDGRTLEIELTRPDPRFLSILALPNTAVVPREAVRHYGESFAEHPVGSGPFRLKEWVRDYKLELVRNPDYRTEYFAEADTPADRMKKLPLADRIVCYQVRQAFAAWLLFLQGRIDVSTLDKDNLDLAAGGGGLSPVLAERGVRLMEFPEFEIRYIGFNFRDPRFARNEKLRQAIALAFDVESRKRHLNNLMVKIAGPIPPGVAGHDPGFVNEFLSHDVARAKRLLTEAGYPDGIDPETGRALELNFDQGNNTSAQRQIGELMATDLAALGIKLNSVLNSTPRFIAKLRQGKTELFRYSWVGDYPDAENFLQLFYSKNIGGCNRTGYSDPVFDRMYERAARLPDSPERTEQYRQMAEYIARRNVWIFEGIPISYQLKYEWLENYRHHDFGFDRWKYLKVDEGKRRTMRERFRPLDFGALRGEAPANLDAKP